MKKRFLLAVLLACSIAICVPALASALPAEGEQADGAALETQATEAQVKAAYAAYEGKLAEWRSNIAYDIAHGGSPNWPYGDWIGRNNLNSLQYGLADIDSNGIPELFITEPGNYCFKHNIWAIYCWTSGSMKAYEAGSFRDHLVLCKANYLRSQYNGPATGEINGYYGVVRLNPKTMEFSGVEGLYYDTAGHATAYAVDSNYKKTGDVYDTKDYIAKLEAYYPTLSVNWRPISEKLVYWEPTKWKRLAGSDRFETMRVIVKTGFSKSGWAVIATGMSFPDALAASSLAGVRNAPVIMTDGRASKLGAAAEAELKRLGVKNAYIMGSSSAVSSGIEKQVKGMGISVTRVSGADRLATSLDAFKKARAAGSKSSTVIVATGMGFADALAIAPYAYWSGSPIVLAGADGKLTAAAAKAIKADGKVKRVVIVGGTGSVSDAVKSQLGSKFTYKRLGGSDRYATSKLIAAWALGQGMNAKRPVVATGMSFPDALAGASLAGKNASVLVLADKSTAPGVKLLAEHSNERVMGYFLGGEGTLGKALVKAIDAKTLPSAYAA